MKTRIFFCALLGLTALFGQTKKSETPACPEEIIKAGQFVKDHFGQGRRPPFAFAYDGQPSASFLTQWNYTETITVLDGLKTEQTSTFTDPKTGLTVRAICTIYSDYPAVEWVLKFNNPTQSNTPIIENVQAVDVDFPYSGQGDFLLHRALGSNAERTDFAPIDEALAPRREIVFGPLEGRSSGNGALPFFNIEAPGEGVMVGIGWTGKWKASVARNETGVIHLAAGMERTHFRLYAQEEVRSPRVLLLFWSGRDRMAGHNSFRRFILKHHTPQQNGRPVTLPLASGLGFGGPSPCNEYSCATESYAIAMAYRLQQFGILPEAGWIDAGWFEGSDLSWARGVGNWFVNRKNFPNGIRPVSEAAKKLGLGFVLWFEPERVYKGTWLAREHPEWLIKLPRLSENDKLFIDPAKNYLLDLGNPEARRWLTDHISGMIESEGITVYRQDFNFDPQEYWRAADAPDRQGITEIKHIEGLYQFWDELLRRHPGLLIDNCASGGRRLDLETISRSAPLWRTDYQYYEPNGYQCHTYGINFYLTCSGTGNNLPETYRWRSSLSSALVFGWDINQPFFPLEQAKKSIAEFKRLRPYFYADYYPLTEYSTSDNAWMAYQFNRPEDGDGIILSFRRNQSPAATCHVRIHGLKAAARYELYFEDYGIKITETGKRLAENGIELKIPEAPGSLLISYKLMTAS
jgi:alpha-galactosidase